MSGPILLAATFAEPDGPLTLTFDRPTGLATFEADIVGTSPIGVGFIGDSAGNTDPVTIEVNILPDVTSHPDGTVSFPAGTFATTGLGTPCPTVTDFPVTDV